MKIFTTWQKPALEPSFAMPTHVSASVSALRPHPDVRPRGTCAGAGMGVVRLDAVRVKGVFPGSPAWSPPIS
jgi:hypothetical protein